MANDGKNTPEIVSYHQGDTMRTLAANAAAALEAKLHEHDNINHPGHYTFGEIEVIDYIRDKMTPDMFQGYCMGNVLKYVSRHKHKNGVEDLKKAQVYLGWMIESEEKSYGS